jgi:hypothetical protein
MPLYRARGLRQKRPHQRARRDVGLAERHGEQVVADPGHRPHVDSTGHRQLVADQIAELHLKRVRQSLGEGGEQHQGPRMALGQERGPVQRLNILADPGRTRALVAAQRPTG